MSQRVPPWSLLLVFLSLLGQLPCRSQGQESQAQQWLDAVSSVPTIVPVSNGRQLYEALQRVNETDMVLQLTQYVDLSDPIWDTAPTTHIPPGRILAITSPLNYLPNVSDSFEALAAAGLKTFNFSLRGDVFLVEPNGTLAFSGLYVTGVPSQQEYLATHPEPKFGPYGLAIYPSLACIPECHVVHNYTIIDYSGGPEDCNQQVLYTTAFRAGVAVNNATAAGIIPNTTAIYILGIGNLSFPIIENPFAPGNLTIGYAEVVIQDDVLRCQTAEQPYLGVLGPPQSSSSNDDLPAWAWVLIALAAVFVGALLAAGGIWGYRHRQRKRATPPIDLPAPASGDPAGSPPGPQGTLAAAGDLFPLSNWSIDFSKAAEATDVDIAALIQLRDAWRTRIGLAHGLEFHDVLGRGGFGSVYRATWHSTVVAVKLVEHSVDSALTRHIQREAALSTSVSHPNIVVTYKVCTVGLKDLQKLPHYVEVSSAAATVGGQRVAPRASPVPPEDDVFDNTETASGDIEMARKSGTSTQRQAASGRAPTVEQNQGAAPSSSTTSDALPSSSSSVLERQASAAFPDDLVATLIVMEFCDLGTVHRAAHDWHAFDINDDPTGKDLVSLLFVLVDVGMALDYLHNVSGIRHGDVKPANVLLKSAGSTRRGWMAKLSDLGVAKMLDPMGRHSATTIDLTGTQNYLAPEQLVAHTQLTKATDCYAFGLLMWELWTGIAPFKDVGIGQLGYRVATLKERPPLPPGMPDDYAKVMQECWAPEADSRPNFEHVLKKLRKMLSTAVAAATAAGRHNQRFLKVLKSKI